MPTLREALDALPLRSAVYRLGNSWLYTTDDIHAARHEGARLALERAIAAVEAMHNHCADMGESVGLYRCQNALRAQLKELNQ